MTLNTGAGSGGVGFSQGTTWGTAVACAANDQIRIRSFDDGGGYEELPRDDIGDANGSASDIGAQRRTVTLTGDLYYGANISRILSFAFGTSGSPTGHTSSHLHELTFTDALTKFTTLVVGKVASAKPYEYASMVCRRLTISGSGSGRMSFDSEWIGGGVSIASSTNTTTTLTALSIPTSTRPAVRLTDATFRINAQAGGALTSTTDDVQIVGWELNIERQLAEDFGTGSNLILQPCEEGANSVTMTVDFRSLTATSEAYIAAWDGQEVPTEYKADITFESGITPTDSVELTHKYSFPRCHVMPSVAPVSGTGRIAHRVVFKCLEATAAPTGMTGITKPVRLSIEDEDSAANLA
jgi:hypothetical protein